MVLLTLPRARQLALSNLIRSTVLSPVLHLQTWLAEVSVMRERLETLRAERDTATTRFVELQNVAEEVMRLRALLELAARDEDRFLPANLYPTGRGSEGVKRSLSLDLGSRAGIAVDAAVVAPKGLVGIVRDVSPFQSTGDFWTQSEFRVSAMTADGRVFGIVRPLSGAPPRMQLDGAPYQLELPSGTPLVTSGLGGVFPRGIPIGKVAETIAAKEGWSRSYLVEPAVYPEGVQEVLVLVSRPADLDLSAMWAPAAQEEPQ